MKKILTIALIFVVSISMAQSKHPRYFMAIVEYMTNDGCTHTNQGWYKNISGNAEGFDEFYKSWVSYVKPYKIIKNTFHFTEYKQITYAQFKSLKKSKFEPCKPVNYGLFSAGSTSKSLIFNLPLDSFAAHIDTPTFHLRANTMKYYDIYYPHIIAVDHIDSTTMVHFLGKATKLNDTTFTFKIKR